MVGWSALAWVLVALLVGAVLTLARLHTPATAPGFAAAALSPWALPCFALALLGLLAVRLLGLRRTGLALALVSVAGLVTHLVWLAPAYLGDHPHSGADLTVLQLNMRYGDADPSATLDLARRSDADVVTLEELTPEAMNALIARGIFDDYPHRTGIPVFGKFGIGIFSRYRLTRVRQLSVSAGAFLMRVHAPRPFWLIAVHLAQPIVNLSGWRKDLAEVTRVAAGLHGPRMVVGDFNATLGLAPMRDLLDTGLADAARQANSGWQPTWPGAHGPHLPGGLGLVQIDHVLVGGGIGAVSTGTHDLAGSDHRALLARLRLPDAATSARAGPRTLVAR